MKHELASSTSLTSGAPPGSSASLLNGLPTRLIESHYENNHALGNKG